MNVREEFDSTTVGGWLTEQLGKIPAAGEKLTFENLEITVAKANNKRVLEVKIKVNPVQEEQESGLEKILGAVREKMKEKTDKDENRESPEPTLIGAGDTEENTETEGQSTKGFTDEELAAYDGRPESET